MNLASLKKGARAIQRRIYSPAYSGYGPMPPVAKQNALRRIFIPAEPVVETGTFQGDSTRAFASRGHQVHTIEVSQDLARTVFPRLQSLGIRCYQGDSGVLLAGILDELVAARAKGVNFWLDGHWSGGPTGKAEAYETPIIPELDTISSYRRRFLQLVVAVDDLRCFGNDPGYPGKKYLVDWAVANDLKFYFLADIFVASTENYPDI
jgi:hypothetical protein